MTMNQVTVLVSTVSGTVSPLKKNSEKQTANSSFSAIMSRFRSPADPLADGQDPKGAFNESPFPSAGRPAEKSGKRSDTSDSAAEKSNERSGISNFAAEESGKRSNISDSVVRKSKKRSNTSGSVSEKKKEKQEKRSTLGPAETDLPTADVSADVKSEKSRTGSSTDMPKIKRHQGSAQAAAAEPAGTKGAVSPKTGKPHAASYSVLSVKLSQAAAVKGTDRLEATNGPPGFHSVLSVRAATAEGAEKSSVPRPPGDRKTGGSQASEGTEAAAAAGRKTNVTNFSTEHFVKGKGLTAAAAGSPEKSAGPAAQPSELPAGPSAGSIQEAVSSREMGSALLNGGLQAARMSDSAAAEVQTALIHRQSAGKQNRSFSADPITDKKLISAETTNKSLTLSGREAGTSPAKESGSEHSGPLQPSAFGRPMSKVELWMAFQKVGGSADKETPVPRQVSETVSEWLAKSSFHMDNNGEQTLTMTLKPEQLGRVIITLTKNADGGIAARMATETKAAKDLLESGLIQLKENFAGSGIPMTQIDVVRSGQTSSAMFQQAAQNQQSFQGGGGQSGGRKEEQRQKAETMSVENEDHGHSFLEWLTGGI